MSAHICPSRDLTREAPAGEASPACPLRTLCDRYTRETPADARWLLPEALGEDCPHFIPNGRAEGAADVPAPGAACHV